MYGARDHGHGRNCWIDARTRQQLALMDQTSEDLDSCMRLGYGELSSFLTQPSVSCAGYDRAW
eukprot:SAG31_NODE_3342_length_4383_cov_5.306723_7_plen_63_part_00